MLVRHQLDWPWGAVQYDGYSQAPNAPSQMPQYQPPSPHLPRMDSYGPPPPPPPPQAPFGAGPQMVRIVLASRLHQRLSMISCQEIGA